AAEAYVLFDVNKSHFEEGANEINFVTKVHRRIKLFKRSSFDRADIEFRRYKKYTRISKIKAAIHLPDGGKIELKNRDVIREDEDDDFEVIKFTFPQVTEGAVIEYSYVRSSGSITTLPKYFFQKDIPVRWAEYQILIPEYYNYVSLSNATRMWDVNENTAIRGTFLGQSVKMSKSRNVLKDLPAYDYEEYTNNFLDYLPQMNLQLSGVRYPNQPYQPVLKDWFHLAKRLMELDDFGKAFNNYGDVSKAMKEMEPVLAKATTEAEKVQLAYQMITRHFSFNDDYSWSTDVNLNRAWDAATGNSAEGNLTMLGVLKQLDIPAKPVLVGLRDRGSHVQVYPLVSQFDHVMVLAEVDGKEVLIDCGSPYRPIGLPRFDALNATAWVVNPDMPRWINLDMPMMSKTTSAAIELTEDGNAAVQLQTRMEGYYAYGGRIQLNNMDDDTEGPVMRELLKVIPEASFVQREVAETDQVYGPLKLIVDVEAPLGMAVDDYLYITPILIPALTKGLTENEDRYTPIDMGYPWKERYFGRVKIPEGYEVEELPQSFKIRSEDSSISCQLNASATDTEVTLNMSVIIKKSTYAAEEYKVLREIFQRIIDTQDSQIIFRKAKK
ncbi:MAG: DUF3857 domain-containing protein, partial [Bacteroidota bacterium]